MEKNTAEHGSESLADLTSDSSRPLTASVNLIKLLSLSLPVYKMG